MLSFELSVVDVVLVMAIIVILLLQLKKAPTESSTEKLSDEKGRPLEDLKSLITRNTSRKREIPTHAPEGSVDCSHHFGYLKTLPLGSVVPEECRSCSRATRCFLIDERNTAQAHDVVS